MQKILGIDIGGKRSGWCYKDSVGENGESWNTGTYSDFYFKIGSLIDQWMPELIIIGKSNIGGSYNLDVVIAQMKLAGIICLLGEKTYTPVIELNDTSARAKVFPGHGRDKKTEIQKLTGIKDPDLNDATVFARAGFILFKEEENVTKD